MDLKKDFPKGTRVRIQVPSYSVESGTVVGFGRRGRSLVVKRDKFKTPVVYAARFLTKLEGGNATNQDQVTEKDLQDRPAQNDGVEVKTKEAASNNPIR